MDLAALITSDMLGVASSSSTTGRNAAGDGNDSANKADLDTRVAKMREAVKGISASNGNSKPSVDALVGHPSRKSKSSPAFMFLQKSLNTYIAHLPERELLPVPLM